MKLIKRIALWFGLAFLILFVASVVIAVVFEDEIGQKLVTEINKGLVNDLEVENLTMDMSGASETTLHGTANNFEIGISGAGDLDAKKLKTRNTSIDISGAGSAIVYAKKTLKIEVSGAGSVQYKGNPKVDQSISGAGSVIQL